MSSRFNGDSRVHVVELTRGDRFYFSRKYALGEGSQGALVEARNSVTRINSFVKGPQTVRRLDRLQKLGLWGTAALEGSPVSSEDAVKVLSGERADVDELSKRELLNIREAYADLDVLADAGEVLRIDEALIKGKHAVLTSGLAMERNEPGVYRNIEQFPEVHSFEVGSKETGGVYKPPRLLRDVETLMREFCGWINSEELLGEHPLIRAGLAHYHLALIHPFWDGNGRLCRLIEAMILASNGVRYTPRYMLKTYYDEYDKYYKIFRQCEKDREKDVAPFLEVVLLAHLSSQNVILNEMHSCLQYELASKWIDDLLKRRTVNARQARLMNLLVEKSDTISISILRREFPYSMIFEKLSEDTVRRDLNNLTELGVLAKDGTFYTLVADFWNSPRIVAAVTGQPG